MPRGSGLCSHLSCLHLPANLKKYRISYNSTIGTQNQKKSDQKVGTHTLPNIIYREQYSASLFIGYMQIRGTVNSKFWQEIEQLDLSYIASGKPKP